MSTERRIGLSEESVGGSRGDSRRRCQMRADEARQERKREPRTGERTLYTLFTFHPTELFHFLKTCQDIRILTTFYFSQFILIQSK